MKKTFAILAAATALSAVASWPAFSLVRSAGAADEGDAALTLPFAAQTAPVILASDDDDDDEDRRDRYRCGDDDDDDDHRRFSRDDDDDDDDDDHRRRGHDDDDDDEGTCGRGSNPAPAGTATPPANGLFGTGAAPQVKMN